MNGVRILDQKIFVIRWNIKEGVGILQQVSDRTQCFPCHGPSSVPGYGAKILQAVHCGQKKKKKKWMNVSSLRLWIFLFLALSSLPKSGRSKTNIPWMNEYGFVFKVADISLVIWLTKTSPRKETALKIFFLSRCWDTEIFYFHALLFFMMDLDYFITGKK